VRVFLIQRFISALFVLFSVSFIVHLVFVSMPIDPVELLCDRYCTPELVAQLNQTLELDRPVLVQLATFYFGLAFGRTMYSGTSAEFFCDAPCLGYSFRSGTSVSEIILDRMPATISLALGAMLIAILVGFALAIISVMKLNSWLDKFIQSTAMILTSIQIYLAGLLVQYLLVFKLNLFPQTGYVGISENVTEWFYALLLPWLTLGVSLAGVYARLIRAKLVDLAQSDFVRTAKSLGQSRNQIMFRGLLRPALAPALALFGVMFGELLGGTVLTELVFNLPGIGRLAADAVAFLDLPVLIGVLLVATLFVVLGNLLADLLHYWADPRINLNN
jgi:peptide/nickel transport system permease protein